MYPPSLNAVTYAPVGCTCSSRVSTETPAQRVSNFDQLVTQWMSTVTSSRGSAWNSGQDHRAPCSTWPWMRKSQRSRSARGVAPADRTGNPSTHVVLARGQSGIAIRARPTATKESP